MKYGIDTQFKKYAYKLPFSRRRFWLSGCALCCKRTVLKAAACPYPGNAYGGIFVYRCGNGDGGGSFY